MFQPRSLKSIATLTSVQCYKTMLKPYLIFENSLFFHAKVAYSAVFREKKQNVRNEHVLWPVLVMHFLKLLVRMSDVGGALELFIKCTCTGAYASYLGCPCVFYILAFLSRRSSLFSSSVFIYLWNRDSLTYFFLYLFLNKIGQTFWLKYCSSFSLSFLKHVFINFWREEGRRREINIDRLHPTQTLLGIDPAT